MREAEKKRRIQYIKDHAPYTRSYYLDWDYSILDYIIVTGRHRNKGQKYTYNDLYMMMDTETSKGHEQELKEVKKKKQKIQKYVAQENHIVLWTLSLRITGYNIVTLCGRTPSELVDCIQLIRDHLKGDRIFCWIHNLSYDWWFIRRFFFKAFGEPIYQLNTKPHYPIIIEFANGLMLKDSAILAQRKLEKWANDLDVEHKKASGEWDYSRIRHQNSLITDEEWHYAECDTLAGVECLDLTAQALGKTVNTLHLTATGIPREEVQKRGGHSAHLSFQQIQPKEYALQLRQEDTYHGGYVHTNRFLIGELMKDVDVFDFSSSYPFELINEKMPGGAWQDGQNCRPEYILKYSEDHAFLFNLCIVNLEINPGEPMPAIQAYKCTKMINPISDNGRIVKADYIEIPLCELDLEYIYPMYHADIWMCREVKWAIKTYLPRWYTDYVFKCFQEKTTFKGGDPVLYSIAKAKLNSLYGLACQLPVHPEIEEAYDTGEYYKVELKPEEMYEKYYNKHGSVLPYSIGIWVTAGATRNLFKLGKMCDTWIYSDTDSCYGIGWHLDEVEAYNNECIQKIKDRGYGGVEHNGRMYHLGVAVHEEKEDSYTEYIALGAKRYCGRQKEDGKLHITVAGVPKKTGAACLKDDIRNFKEGFIFDGETTGKLTHIYNNAEIHIDEHGNEVADSVDLIPCSYLLDKAEERSIDSIGEEDFEPIYDEEQLDGWS